MQTNQLELLITAREEASAKLRQLSSELAKNRAELKALMDTQSGMGYMTATTARNLEAQTAALRSQASATAVSTEMLKLRTAALNEQVVAEARAAIAAEDAAARYAAADAVLARRLATQARAQGPFLQARGPGGRFQSFEDFYGARTMGAAAVMAAAITSNNEAQMRRISDAQTLAAQKAAVTWKTASADSINSMLGIGTASKISAAEVNAAFGGVGGRLKSYFMDAGEESGKSFWSRFFQPRTTISLLDEWMRGQRGQIAATIGAGFKRAGMAAEGLTMPLVGIAGGTLSIAGSSAAILHMAHAMGELAENTAAAAASTGLSVKNYAQLQGALILSGAKAEAADASLRMFAMNVEKALANSSSRAAKALHAIGISQDEINKKGMDTAGMFQLVITKLASADQTTSTFGAALEAIFGRGNAIIARLAAEGPEAFRHMLQEAEPFAAAADRNNKELKKMTEEMNRLSLKWLEVKYNATPAFDFILGGLSGMASAISGLITLVESLGQAYGRLASSFGTMMKSAIAELERHSKIGGVFKFLFGDQTGDQTAQVTLPDVNVSGKAPSKIPPFDTKTGKGATPWQTYSEFASEEREKLQVARGDTAAQVAILEEWKAKAQSVFAENTLNYKKAMNEINRASREAANQQISDLEKVVNMMQRVIDLSQKAFEKKLDASVRRGEISPLEAINQEKVHLLELYADQIERLNSEMKVADQYASAMGRPTGAAAEGRGTEAQRDVWMRQFDLGAKLQEQLETLDDKAAQIAEKASKKFAEPFQRVFDQLGSSLEKSITDALLHKGSTAKNLKDLYQSAVGDAVHIAGSALSQVGGRILDPKGEGGIGEVASKYLAQMVTQFLTQIGLLGNIAATSAATAASTAATAASSTAQAASSVPSAAGGIGGALSGAITVGKWIAGLGIFSGARGGIVPAAAGGWELPSSFGSDRILSALTPGEMVLPVGEKPSALAAAIGNRPNVNLHIGAGGMFADGPSFMRWLKDNGGLDLIHGAVRSGLRSNAMTPRNLAGQGIHR